MGKSALTPVSPGVRQILKYMQKMIVYEKLNEIIKIGEDKIKIFHSVRNEVDSHNAGMPATQHLR